MFSGIKSVIYPSSDLEADKRFWQLVTGIEPYFDEEYYVGFSVNGCELGLDPNAAKEGITSPIAYWHVQNIDSAMEMLMEAGATVEREIKDVGGGVRMGTLRDHSGNIFGIIERLEDDVPEEPVDAPQEEAPLPPEDEAFGTPADLPPEGDDVTNQLNR